MLGLKSAFEKIPDSFKKLVKTKYKKSLVYALSHVGDNYVPKFNDIFNAFTCYDSIRVVIIGQDPYPNDDAHGYAFSSLGRIPPSIKYIYKCMLKHNLISKMPTHASLVSWADQGVLLLNAALTCKRGESGSHMNIWSSFTSEVISDLDNKDIVFILLGNFAVNLVKLEHAYILTWGHPSPLNSVNRDENNPKSFINATVFNDANEYLVSRGLDPINWDSVND